MSKPNQRVVFGPFPYDSDEEEEEERRKRRKKMQMKILLSCCVPPLPLGVDSRDSYHVRPRLDWFEHVDHLHKEGNNSFYAFYRMNYLSYMKLVHLIDPIFLKKGSPGRAQKWRGH